MAFREINQKEFQMTLKWKQKNKKAKKNTTEKQTSAVKGSWASGPDEGWILALHVSFAVSADSSFTNLSFLIWNTGVTLWQQSNEIQFKKEKLLSRSIHRLQQKMLTTMAYRYYNEHFMLVCGQQLLLFID